jgi:DNA-binding CsgD family transcriptional regulator/tetratricopeptide (TPR) repeat protein
VTELLERGDLLATLEAGLEGGLLMLVAGEAGAGKTSLVRSFCAGADARVLWGACDALFTPRALGPVLDVAEQAGGELAELAAADARPSEFLGALLRELRADGPTVLVLEDLHWADEGTLDLLRLLGRRVATVPALVIATFRDDELDAAEPLRIVLGELATSPGVRRLRVPLLSRDAVRSLAAAHDVDPDELYGRTGGNAFYVTEALAASGVPDSVRDAVLARAARLGPEARAVLEAVAVIPQRTELDLLSAVAPGPLDECLAGGMLVADATTVGFRHELARLAVEAGIPAPRRAALHRAVLDELAERGADAARLAHHAEAAGDDEAVRRHAPVAARRAARLGAHRESAAQYARALRVSGSLSPAERAELFEARSYQCYLTNQIDAAIVAREQALALYRELGDPLREGDCLRWLSRLQWFMGRNELAAARAAEAIARLDQLPPGRELAMAYSNMAQLRMLADDVDGTVEWGERALFLAQQLGDSEIVVHALNNLGSAQSRVGREEGFARLRRSLEIARAEGLEEHVARAYCNLAATAVEHHDPVAAGQALTDAIDYCTERDLDSWRLYLLAWRSRYELDCGRWTEAAETAGEVLRHPRTATISRIPALVVLGLVRLRRGDPDASGPLAEALEHARGTGEMQRLSPVARALAEAAWLRGDAAAVCDAVSIAWELVLATADPWHVGDLAVWRRRAGVQEEPPAFVAPPYARWLAGDLAGAAAEWDALACPYEAALARAEGGDADALVKMGARPAARRLGRRGPRRRTEANPAGLTDRELQVLAMLADGMRNSEIAERLVLSVRTVDHHVSEVLRKLGVPTRARASAEAVRLGVVPG